MSGEPAVLFEMAHILHQAGNRKGAEQALLQAGEAGHPQALIKLFLLCKKAGDHTRAEGIVKQALDAATAWGGTGKDVFQMWPYGLDPDGTPTPPW
ncbi:hypothetical protein [Streptomyces sp. NBC_00353]|uniref:tetratricopeptide repeat protein n=1 Tax=unclassified Streptomyces TaxID=2593676 RepID=UPI002E254324